MPDLIESEGFGCREELAGGIEPKAQDINASVSLDRYVQRFTTFRKGHYCMGGIDIAAPVREWMDTNSCCHGQADLPPSLQMAFDDMLSCALDFSPSLRDIPYSQD